MEEQTESQYTYILNKVWDLYDIKNVNQAITEANKIIEEYPQKVGGYYIMGMIEFDKKNHANL